MRPWLKAGLIGGGVLSILTIIMSLGALLPPGAISTMISCCSCIFFLLACAGTGVLAAYWLTPPRMAGEGAKEGALAGVIAGAIDGLVTMVMTIAVGPGMYQQFLQQLPPESVLALEEAGLSQLFTPGGLAASGCLGGICGILWAVALGAAGGAILAAAKKE